MAETRRHQIESGGAKAEATPNPLEVWERLLRTVVGLLRVYEEDMRNHGLPLPWYDVLIQLNAAPEGRLRMQTLADSVILSRSGLTRLVDRMEQAGLVRREASKEDRRGAYAILTEEGRKTFQRLRPGHHESIHEHFTRHLSDADLRVLDAAVEKIRNGNRN